MNGNTFFNNQSSNQFNNQPANNGGTTPERHVKKKFFSSAFMDNKDIMNNVGGTNSTSNNSVVAWGIGNSSAPVGQPVGFSAGPQTRGIAAVTQPNVVAGVDTPGLSIASSTQPPERKRKTFFNKFGLNKGNQGEEETSPSLEPAPQIEQSVTSQVNDNSSLGFGVIGNQNANTMQQVPNNIESLETNNQVITENMPSNNLPMVSQPVVGNQTMSPEAIEMLQNVNGTVIFEEPEVLDEYDLPDAQEKIEELDFPEEVSTVSSGPEEIEELDFEPNEVSPITVPHIDQNAPIEGPLKPVINPPVNQNQPSVGVFKPQGAEGNNMNLGYNTEAVNPALAIGAVGTVAGSVPPPAGVLLPQATMENSAIFQASQQNSNQPVAPVQTRVDNTPVEQWMTNQPLSPTNVENSTAGQSNVISANKREEMAKKNNSGDTTPVPEEVTKKAGDTNIRTELLVKEYIGEDYQSLTMSPFNFGAFVFGAIYYGYRKVYFWCLVNLGIVMGLLYFVPFKYNFLAVLGFHLFMALSFNRVYITHVKMLAKMQKKTNSFKKNPRTQDELESVMRRSGKVSVINAILVLCIFLSGIYFISMYVLKDNEFSKMVVKSIGVSKKVYKRAKFEGTIIYDKEQNVNELIDIKIPEVFEGSGDKFIDYIYTTMSEGKNNQCSIRVGVIEDSVDGNSYVVEMASYYEEEDKVKSAETKGISWTNYYTENNDSIIYYKGTTINEKALVLEYKIGKDSSENVCDTFFLDIMESIELKEE